MADSLLSVLDIHFRRWIRTHPTSFRCNPDDNIDIHFNDGDYIVSPNRKCVAEMNNSSFSIYSAYWPTIKNIIWQPTMHISYFFAAEVDENLYIYITNSEAIWCQMCYGLAGIHCLSMNDSGTLSCSSGQYFWFHSTILFHPRYRITLIKYLTFHFVKTNFSHKPFYSYSCAKCKVIRVVMGCTIRIYFSTDRSAYLLQ